MEALNEEKARADLAEVCRTAYQRGYISGVEGNFSLRLNIDTLLTTPAGCCKGRLNASDFLLTNLDGVPLDVASNRGKKPSTELKMHLAVYQHRKDAMAVVHAHPTVATAFTIAGRSLNRCISPEAVLSLGEIGVAPYATPSTEEVPASIIPLLAHCNTLLLAHHGTLTFAQDIWNAFYKLEALEQHAKTLLIANMLGGEKTLTGEQVSQLFSVCQVYGMEAPENTERLIKMGTGE